MVLTLVAFTRGRERFPGPAHLQPQAGGRTGPGGGEAEGQVARRASPGLPGEHRWASPAGLLALGQTGQQEGESWPFRLGAQSRQGQSVAESWARLRGRSTAVCLRAAGQGLRKGRT